MRNRSDREQQPCNQRPTHHSYLPLKRANVNNDMSACGAPSRDHCAAASPMALENLKPCPEHALITSTLSCRGCESKMKWRSGVFVYMHTSHCDSSPSRLGTWTLA